MNDKVADIARKVALDVSPNSVELPVELEHQLTLSAEDRAGTFSDPAASVAIAALIIQVAQFAWQIYHDEKASLKTHSRDEFEKDLDEGMDWPRGIPRPVQLKILKSVIYHIHLD